VFTELAPYPPETGILAIAGRPQVDIAAILDPRSAAPVVLLEAPAHLGNLGAVVRVAAAAGAAVVLTTGPQDPWHPAALRGSAGLHFALPVARIDRLPTEGDRPLIAVHPDGEPLRPGALPRRAILAFGSERRGLSREMRDAADRQIAIPMRPGVSSLNLASAVAVILYTWRLTVDAARA
jgi:TrmH family RNA methyltransferase